MCNYELWYNLKYKLDCLEVLIGDHAMISFEDCHNIIDKVFENLSKRGPKEMKKK